MTPPVRVPVTWVDAFADRAFAGNPAAVCLLEGPAEATWMQGLAAEFGISETAYLWPVAGGWSLRWFTPATEVDLCGHATLAAAHALRAAGREPDGARVVFTTRSGPLLARLAGELIELDLPADPPRDAPVPAALATALARPDGSALATMGGARSTAFFVAVLAQAADVRTAVVDVAALGALADQAVIVTAPGPDPGAPGADYVLRVFGPNVGIDEDPVTGSAQCVLAPYWAPRLGSTALRAAQVSARGGRLEVVLDGVRVRIAGRAVTVLEGTVAGGRA